MIQLAPLGPTQGFAISFYSSSTGRLALHSLSCKRDLGFKGLEPSLIFWRIFIDFIPDFFNKKKGIPYFYMISTGFSHRLPTGNGESAAWNCAAHSANYSISCGHPMAEPGTLNDSGTIPQCITRLIYNI